MRSTIKKIMAMFPQNIRNDNGHEIRKKAGWIVIQKYDNSYVYVRPSQIT